jgi:GGDEF domain-containing protein
MSYLFTRLLIALACVCACPLWAAGTGMVNPIVLGQEVHAFEISHDIQAWLDTGSHANIGDAWAADAEFTAQPALSKFSLTAQDTLWIKLRVVRRSEDAPNWTLDIPIPYVDSVTLYQRNEARGWTAQTAGDRLSQAEWSKRGFYPEFDLTLPLGVPQDLVLQIRNFKQITVPIRLASSAARERQQQLETILLGLMLGALVAVASLCAVRYLEGRHTADLWAALYGLVVMVAIAQVNGVLNTFVWTRLPNWANYAFSVIPMITVGSTLLFLRELYARSTRFSRYDILLTRTAIGTLASVLAYAVVDQSAADMASAVVLLFATSVGLAATAMSWHGGSSIWRWLVLAFFFQYIGVVGFLAEMIGLVPMVWEFRYVASLCAALSVPVLVYALGKVTQDRKQLDVRAHRRPTQDALTGLLTPEAFGQLLEGAAQRVAATREPISLVMVKVINHEHIRLTLGDAVAEQCLLRTVVKLHRILRDVDPAGRLGTAQFGLLMEGIVSRRALTERMVQLLASGLIPLPGLEPELTLQFQVACVMLHQYPMEPDVALAALNDVLAEMSPHTRRPIRFIEERPTQPGELHIDDLTQALTRRTA